MPNRFRTSVQHASFVAMAMAWTAPALAASEPSTAQSADAAAAQPVETSTAEDDAIVVTARKRSERLLDVPQTISAMSGETLERAGVRDLDGLGRTIPNVMLNRRGDNEPNVVIRGIGSFGNVQGVGFYVDDIQNFFDQSARIVDLERVEVLKGPQGTLYGGNSIGGAVKYVTRKPGRELEGTLSAEAGGQDIVNVSGSVNIPFSETVALRVSAYSANNNGFLFNPLLNENNDRSREGGVRAVLRIQPTDRTDINISARISHFETGNDYHLVSSTADYNEIAEVNERAFNKRRVWGVTADINHDFGQVTLTSLTSYSERRTHLRWDFDYSGLDLNLLTQPHPLTGKHFSQELRLSSNGDGPFNWLIGGFASRMRNGNQVLRADIRVGVDAGEAFPGAPVPLIVPDYFNRATLETNFAGFANTTYEFGPFELGIGARLNHVKFKGTEKHGAVTATVSDTVVLPKATLSYKPGDGLLIYASAAQGYEPGRTTIGTFVNPGFVVPYKPEKSTNYEVGFKGEVLDHKLQFEIAGFYIKYKDRQFETQVRDDLGNVLEVIDNIGDATSWGIEGSLTLRPAAGLSVTASGGYLDSKWDHAVYFLQNYDGNRSPFSPKFSGNIAVDYKLPVTDSHSLSLRADMTHSSSFFWDVPNLARQKAYQIVGLRAALAPDNGPWEISVRIQNLFNKGYNTEFVRNGAGSGADVARRGQPRLILGALSYKF